jgi:alkanesulfonate monooxygenase SsuD/methylene tetrahydromethanopterin reductase-like flavin-dependent oxidoreductase (luciferase family)
MSRLRFGTFLAPFHVPGQNPTRALHHDLALMEHMDELGFDEAWIGEHHSAGSEIIASPEIFIAAASQRTRNIRFGTGVTSLSYHNPLWVADRMVMLDHLTRGRVMLGVGPGSLPTDSMMIGLNPTETRELLEVNLGLHWGVMEEQAKAYGTTVDRSQWRLVSPMHIAPTRAQAEAEVEFGLEAWFNYFQHVAAFPQMAVEGGNLTEMVAFIRDAGVGVIGTAEDGVEKIRALQEQSGGFGCVLLLAHDWADPEATRRSLDIIARDVMPEFQGQRQPTLDAEAKASKLREGYAQAQLDAVAHMTAKYESEKTPCGEGAIA